MLVMNPPVACSYQTPARDGWAVITGCTSGIGLAFVHVIARAKINIVLVSRDETKLKTLQQNIQGMERSMTTLIFIFIFIFIFIRNLLMLMIDD